MCRGNWTCDNCAILPNQLAVEAVFESFIVEVAALEAETLTIGTGLFRSGIGWVYRHYRAIDGAHSAFDTLLEIVFAYVVFLHIHSAILLWCGQQPKQ